MAKKKDLSLNEFLNTLSLSKRDRWVAERMLKTSELKSATAWNKEFKEKCKGINVKNS